ncbi:hypothetical protein [Streptomyces chryseus]
MSDREEATTDRLMRRLAAYAQGITAVLGNLPLPITIPTGEDASLMSDVRPSIIRAYEIVDEQPLPEALEILLIPTLLHWITGAELIVGYALTGAQHRADAAVLNMLAGEMFLADIIEWQATQGRDASQE